MTKEIFKSKVIEVYEQLTFSLDEEHLKNAIKGLAEILANLESSKINAQTHAQIAAIEYIIDGLSNLDALETVLEEIEYNYSVEDTDILDYDFSLADYYYREVYALFYEYIN